jgi:exodeoxyribonuclease VII large subunit
MRLTNCWQRLARAAQGLDTLSPLSTLHRGYSITLLLPGEKLLRDAQAVKPGDRLETRLESGVVLSRVEESIPNPNPT